MTNRTRIEREANKLRILLFATDMEATGGGNCVGAWAMQAFTPDCDVSLMCTDRPDIGALNQQFGTRLDPDRITVHTLSRPLHWLSKRIDPSTNSIWPLAFLIRKVHRTGRNFDVILSINNEVDLGRPGFQYVHFPLFGDQMPTLRKYGDAPAWKRFRGFLKGEYRPWMAFTDTRASRIEKNVFLTNSNWTAGEIREHYPVDPIVLYPPVNLVPNTVPWPQRQPSFVMLGRVSGYKRQLAGIEILKAVRERGHAVELHIIGDPARNDDGDYFRLVRNRQETVGGWVHLHVSIGREELETIVSRCRFGLHLHPQEHFGIAIAEMMSSGCIVLTPNDGGQVEIVGPDSGLTFDDEADAIDKICALLEDEQRQRELSERQRQRAARFSTGNFMNQLRKIVAERPEIKPPSR